MNTKRTPDQKFQTAVDNAIARENRAAIEEQRAIDACDHSRATVEDRDVRYSPDGMYPIGAVEYISCPDCPLGDWFAVDVEQRKANEL